MKDPHRAFESIYLLSQIVIIILFMFCTEYSDGVHPSAVSTGAAALEAKDIVQTFYPVFQDVHVMIFIGFGFLMVFLKTHSWTSVGYNFLISAYVLQITILITGFWHQALHRGEDGWHRLPLDITSLIIGDFGAGAVMITFGAVLGKISLSQMWLLATLEIVFYGLNEAICAGELGAVDMGGSMYVHTFGAYFGCAASYFFLPKKALADPKCEGSYNSQLIAMIGTLFLWMFWPSFNGALAADFQQQRVIVNTVMAISASCVTACALSRMMLQRLNMEVVLNATLAGGVSVGSSSDLVVTAGTAMLIGAIAGLVSAFGFLKLNGFLQRKIGLHDTCGVHNLHGLPGVLGAVIGAISASLADSSFDSEEALFDTFEKLKEGRTTSEQGWIQLAALGITLAFSIIGGLISGFIASRFQTLEKQFEDTEHFEEVEYPPEDGHHAKESELASVPQTARTEENDLK